MNDNDIITAYEKCISNDQSKCHGCPLSGSDIDCDEIEKYVLDIVKKYKAENERMNRIRAKLSKEIDHIRYTLEMVESEPVKKIVDISKRAYEIYKYVPEYIAESLKQNEDDCWSTRVKALQMKNEQLHNVIVNENMNSDHVLAENDRLKQKVKGFQELWCEAESDLRTARAEAIKEFAERLKASKIKPEFPWDDFYVTEHEIDNLVKEMTEGEKCQEQ